MVDKVYKNMSNAFSVFSYADDYDTLFCITIDRILVKICIKDFTMQYIELNSGQEYLEGFNSTHSIYSNGKIFLFSYDGSMYLVYDIKLNEIYKHDIGGIHPTDLYDRSNILDVKYNGGSIFCFIRSNSLIVIVNAMTGEIKDTLSLKADISKAIAVFHNGKEYFFNNNASIVECFDFDNKELVEINFKTEMDNLECVYSDGTNLYFLSNSGAVTMTNFIENRKLCDIHGKKDEFSLVFKTGDIIWVFPKFGEDIYYIDINGIGHKYEQYDDDFRYCAEKTWFEIGWKYINYLDIGDIIIFPLRIGNKMILVDKENGKLSMRPINMPSKSNLIKYLLETKYILKEGSSNINIDDFLDYVDMTI